MLDRLKEELMTKQNLHEELVKKYDEKVAEMDKLKAELMQIEKEIIHNQGAMNAINDLGMELLEQSEKAETIPAEEVEIVEQ